MGCLPSRHRAHKIHVSVHGKFLELRPLDHKKLYFMKSAVFEKFNNELIHETDNSYINKIVINKEHRPNYSHKFKIIGEM